jgi:hypothetical protein
VDVDEYFLDKVICLSFVPENSLTDISDSMSVAPEEQRKSVTVACLDACNQRLICKFR